MTEGDPHRRTHCLHNAHLDHVGALLERQEFFWLDLEDPGADTIHRLAEVLTLHPLTVDDALEFRERPKMEDYDGYVFLVIYGVDTDAAAGERLLREIHMIISGDCVVTIHHGRVAALEEIRRRYADQPLRGEQFLIYKIIDAVTETYFPVLARIDDEIDEVEQEVIAEPREESLQRIFSLKRDLVGMRRVVTPMRDVFARNAERIAELPGMEPADRLYWRDLYDGLIRVSDLVDSYRDLLSGATDMYLSTVANRQGEVNKQLTIIATIFLPLTFITGFFGQNFSFMINHLLNTELSFIIFGVGSLVVSVVGFLVFFRRRRWM